MLSFKKVRLSPQLLYLVSISTVMGFITNRLNIALIGLENYFGHRYVPKWTEFSITLMIIAMGFALFGLAVRYLPIFDTEAGRKLEEPERVRVDAGVLSHAGD
jgi:Ni/Fe-hydrogenase subunit HybB-like protein